MNYFHNIINRIVHWRLWCNVRFYTKRKHRSKNQRSTLRFEGENFLQLEYIIIFLDTQLKDEVIQ